MPDVDIGSVYARVGLDISELNANEQKAVLKMREMAAEQEKLTQKAMSQKRAISDLSAEIEKMRAALAASQYSDATVFEGIDSQKIQNIITQLGNLDREYDLLSKKQAQQKATVEELNAAFEKAQMLGLQNAIKQQATELETANKALEKTNAELQRVRENEEQLKGKLFTTAETEIDNKSKALGVLNTSLSQTQTELEDTTNRQKAFDAQLAQNSARVNAGTSINAMVSGLRSMGVVTGDTSGFVSDLVSQLTAAKQAMNAAQVAGAGMAATFSMITAGIGIIIAVIAKVVNSYKEAQEAQRKLFEEAIGYIEEYGEKLDTYQRMTEIINDEKSSIDDVTSARQTLASTFKDMIAGYDDEGNAILISNDAMQKYINTLNELYEAKLRAIAFDESSFKDYETAEKEYKDVISSISRWGTGINQSKLAEAEAKKIEAGMKSFEVYSAKTRLFAQQQFGGTLNSSQEALISDFMSKNRALFSAGKIDAKDYSEILNNTLIPTLKNWKENVKDLQTTSEEGVTTYKDELENINHLRNMGQISAAEELSALEDLYNKYKGDAEAKKDLALEIHNLKEEIYEDDYSTQVDNIESLNSLGQISAEEEIARYEQLLSQYQGDAEKRMEIEQKLYDLKAQLYEDDFNAQQQHIEDMKALGQLSTAGEIAMYEKLLKEYQKDTEIKMELEKKLYSLKQQLYDEEYNAARKQINHLKNTGQLTTEQEIAGLQQLLAKYKDNADIRMQLEEDIYALKQSLLKDEEKAVKKSTEKYVSDVYSAVQEALKAKYEAQKEAEQSVLKESIEHWKEWEDETVASIQAQIDELDKLAEAQEHEEKVSKLNQDLQALDLKMQFEHDGYNLSQLQKEKNRIQEELNDEYISQMQKNDKSDLQAELDVAKAKSEAEQKALQEQLDASTEKYDKLTEAANLSIEAQKLIITKGQQAIVELIKSYAPDYFDSGETIGEQFVYGLNMSLEGVQSYFAAIRQMVIDNQNQVAAAFSGAASDFWKTKTSYEAKIASNSNTVNNHYTTTEDRRTIQVTVNSSDILDDPIRMNRLCEKIVSYITKNM